MVKIKLVRKIMEFFLDPLEYLIHTESYLARDIKIKKAILENKEFELNWILDQIDSMIKSRIESGMYESNQSYQVGGFEVKVGKNNYEIY